MPYRSQQSEPTMQGQSLRGDAMSAPPAPVNEDRQQFQRVVAESVELRTHSDVIDWLQGDMQEYFPHDILIAAWGDFRHGDVQHDILSGLRGARARQADPVALTPLLTRCFIRWSEHGKLPFGLHAGQSGFHLADPHSSHGLSEALHGMRSAMVHGVHDARRSHDCLYIAFSAQLTYSAADCAAMATVLPCIDTALRQVEHLPQVARLPAEARALPEAAAPLEQALSGRELEILHWIAQGKTNPEIGSILDISVFTVKNHIQRFFRKLNVSNRAQAVAQYRTVSSDD